MPKLLFLAVALLGVLTPAALADASTPKPIQRCVVSDPRINNGSGLVVLNGRYFIINDRGSHEPTVRVYRLNAQCRVTAVLKSPGVPSDIEDLARTPDGTLWLADIGDNDSDRSDVTIWQMSSKGGNATPYHLTYPDGPHNAEALVMTANRTPIIVTKIPSGESHVYVAPHALAGNSDAPIPMRDAGVLRIRSTKTQGGAPGHQKEDSVLVTGAAVSADGTRVALRTYTDVYEWRIRAGATANRIARTILTRTPDRTPVPGESQGESIAYADHATRMLTLSEGLDKPVLQWQPHRPATSRPSHLGLWAGLGLIVVVLLLGAGFLIIRRRRKHSSVARVS